MKLSLTVSNLFLNMSFYSFFFNFVTKIPNIRESFIMHDNR